MVHHVALHHHRLWGTSSFSFLNLLLPPLPLFRSRKQCYPLTPRCLSTSAPRRKKLVFLGTPNVAARVLDQLLSASQEDTVEFEISAVVTQPPAAKGRGKKLSPSSVAELAMERNFPTSKIFWPEKAGEENFLMDMKELQPDLCITAAYGNILPKKFLDIPTYGTVNIHPSLLPLYRGAAPVQRAIQDGVPVTGVTIAFTVRAMDAGPIITSESLEIDDHIKAPELLQLLFEKGVQLLLRELPLILNGSAAEKAKDQDHTKATHAPKVTIDEGWLDFNQPAHVLHNKVRAFADWPGTKATFQVLNIEGEAVQNMDLKIITTKYNFGQASCEQEDDRNLVIYQNSSLLVFCGGNSSLEILELQPPGKRVMSAKDFINGLRGQRLRVMGRRE